MLGCRQSELAENAKFIRMNEELAIKLHELGRQMNALVNEIKDRISGEAVKPTEDDHVHRAGC